MLGDLKMIAIQNQLFANLTDASKNAVNDFIEFLYHKENSDETLQAMNDAVSGKTYGPFDSVDALMQDLYEDD